MPRYCLSPSSAALLLLAVLSACVHRQPQVVDLVRTGDYRAAIERTEHEKLSAAEIDGVTGSLILQGLVDPAATARPPYTVADGLARMERAAAAGRMQSAADLKGKFTTGINHRGGNQLLAPNAELAGCWAKVEDGKEKAAACIALRKQSR